MNISINPKGAGYVTIDGALQLASMTASGDISANDATLSGNASVAGLRHGRRRCNG